MCELTDLPVELLVHIYRYLSDKDRNSLSCCSKLIRTIFSQNVGYRKWTLTDESISSQFFENIIYRNIYAKNTIIDPKIPINSSVKKKLREIGVMVLPNPPERQRIIPFVSKWI